MGSVWIREGCPAYTRWNPLMSRYVARCFFNLSLVWFVAIVWSSAAWLHAQTDSIDFDRDVAPILARACLHCHDATSQKGGLDLSSKDRAFQGGEQGRVLMPADVDQSELYQRVVADDMPPDEPLPEGEKEVLRRWIEQGATWGTDPIDPFRYSNSNRAGYDWWAWQPLKKPIVPAQQDSNWGHNEIDALVLAGLQHAKLPPSPTASGQTLLRRLYLNLIGLPPLLRPSTKVNSQGRPYVHESLLDLELDLDDFAGNEATYQLVVDRLLDSPHYGERWARHWLDVVRFGESQGFERNRIRENAWRYRDWVISAFNQDMPYDEFVRQQIAGDVLYPGELEPLLATGFLVAGTWDQVGHKEGRPEMQKVARQDHLEELVGAVGQTFLGLTVNCARCHDHKFDPLRQRDYYQIAATLAGVHQEVDERSGIQVSIEDTAHQRWLVERERLHQELSAFETALRERYLLGESTRVAEGLVAAYLSEGAEAKSWNSWFNPQESVQLSPQPNGAWVTNQPAFPVIRSLSSANEFTVELWLTSQTLTQKGPARIVTISLDTGQRNFTLGQLDDRFDVRLRTTKTDGNGLPSTSTPPGSVTTAKTHVAVTFRSGTVHVYVNGRLAAEQSVDGDLSNWNDSFRLAIGNEVTGDRAWQGQVHLLAIYQRALSTEEVVQQFTTDSASVRNVAPLSQLLGQATDSERATYESLQGTLQRHLAAEPPKSFVGVAHVPQFREPEITYVLARGNPRTPGEAVAPGGLGLLAACGLSPDFALPNDASDAARRERLAAWISNAQNPLLARVIANRVWHYHFGRGIVDTPSDFGYSGGRPTHPELLDFLAGRLVEQGWRLKDLQRLIVTSATWRQTSAPPEHPAWEIDGDNQWLWRANRRRLDAESVRDSVLAISGQLDRQLGGPSYRDLDVSTDGPNVFFRDPKTEIEPALRRRAIYRLWARSGSHPFLDSLDCADPSVSQPRRAETITPVQSLTLLNNPLMEFAAAKLIERLTVEHEGPHESDAKALEPEVLVSQLFQSILGREPNTEEQAACVRLATTHGAVHVAIVLFNTNEFMFIE